jgi:hypothetical protein
VTEFVNVTYVTGSETPGESMIATDLRIRRKHAGISTQDELVSRLPALPTGSRITRDFYGRIERCECEVAPDVYQSIIATIDEIAAERAEKSAA